MRELYLITTLFGLLFSIPAGYLSFRFIPYRRERWWFYLSFIVLFLGFNALSISFTLDIFDYIMAGFFFSLFAKCCGVFNS